MINWDRRYLLNKHDDYTMHDEFITFSLYNEPDICYWSTLSENQIPTESIIKERVWHHQRMDSLKVTTLIVKNNQSVTAWIFLLI